MTVSAKRFAQVGLVVATVAAAALTVHHWSQPRAPISLEAFPSLGRLERFPSLSMGDDESAPDVLVFGDYACPSCRKFERLIGDSLRALAERGEIVLRYYYAPIIAPGADLLARVLACARSAGRGWQVHDAIREHLDARGSEFDREAIYAAIREGSAANPSTSCWDTAGRAPLEEARALAAALAIHEVPTVVVDGSRVRFRSVRSLLDFIKSKAADRILPD